jgi:hypothetical protein
MDGIVSACGDSVLLAAGLWPTSMLDYGLWCCPQLLRYAVSETRLAVVFRRRSHGSSSSADMGLKRSLVEGTDVNVFIPVLTEIANLTDTAYAIVATTARSILIEQTIPTVEQRRQKLKVRR